MMNRRKDAGFTLIELMIVIAVIGIIAVVLVPKVAGIKIAAKSSGIDANIRKVQALVQFRVTNWSNSYSTDNITDELEVEFGDGAADPLINPINGTTTNAIVVGALPVTPVDRTPGTIYVALPADATTLMSTGLVIWGVDNNLNVYNSVTIKP